MPHLGLCGADCAQPRRRDLKLLPGASRTAGCVQHGCLSGAVLCKQMTNSAYHACLPHWSSTITHADHWQVASRLHFEQTQSPARAWFGTALGCSEQFMMQLTGPEATHCAHSSTGPGTDHRFSLFHGTRERGEVTGSSWIGSRVTTHVKVYTSSAIHGHGRKHMELFVSAVPGWWT